VEKENSPRRGRDFFGARTPQRTETTMKDIAALCGEIRQTAYQIHVYHAHGHLEKVYENALAHRLRKAGLDVKQQHPIQVFDEDGALIGDYLADCSWRVRSLSN
jgi:hypothetical protein